MKYLIQTLIAVVLASCTQTHSPSAKLRAEQSIKRSKPIIGKETSVATISLKSIFQFTDLSQARNIGEFFDHRLRFYKIDQPDITINKSPVDELVMYFIDSTLARMRYEVKEEVGSYLLDSLGMSKFKPLDSISKVLLKNKNVYDRITSRLNPELHNYELIWRNEGSVKRYKVKTYDSLTKYYYYHEMYGYKQKIRELEAMYYYLENSLPVVD